MGRGRAHAWDFLFQRYAGDHLGVVCQRLVPAFLEHPEFDLSRLSAWLNEFEGESFAKAGLEGAVCDLLANVASKPCGKY